jgi:hypothetical protein
MLLYDVKAAVICELQLYEQERSSLYKGWKVRRKSRNLGDSRQALDRYSKWLLSRESRLPFVCHRIPVTVCVVYELWVYSSVRESSFFV